MSDSQFVLHSWHAPHYRRGFKRDCLNVLRGLGNSPIAFLGLVATASHNAEISMLAYTCNDPFVRNMLRQDFNITPVSSPRVAADPIISTILSTKHTKIAYQT